MFSLLGMLAERPTTLRDSLPDAPRSVDWLSQEHPQGCGIALCSAEKTWHLHKNAGRVRADPVLYEIATAEAAEIVLAHVRQRTVGRVRLDNTQPFRHDRWVFAHKGTIRDLDFLRRRTSAKRARQVGGDTDSELLFAYLLSCLDAGHATGVDPADPADPADAALTFAAREMGEHSAPGEYSFLMSDGASLYAYRHGIPLFVLQRRQRQGDSAPSFGVVLVASDRISDEAWQLEELALLRVDRQPFPRLRVLARGLQSQTEPQPASTPELPFTD
jgi:predicted glutamine amidotransferase